MSVPTPKTQMLLNTLNESLEDLITECWTVKVQEQHEKVKNELAILTTLLIEENK